MPTPIQRINSDPTVLAKLSKLRAMFKDYEKFVLLNTDAMYPDHAVVRLTQEVAAASDAADAQAIMEQIAKLSGPGAAMYAQTIKGRAVQMFEPVRSALLGLLDIAEGLLSSYKGDALRAEGAFFASHGLPAQPTAVSKQYEAALVEARSIRASMNEPQTFSIVPQVAPSSHPAARFFSV